MPTTNAGLKFPINWSDEQAIRRAFTWATRVGIGRNVGMPIGWYQQHQCAALDILEQSGRGVLIARGATSAHLLRIRLHLGRFEAMKLAYPTDPTMSMWTPLPLTPREVFERADRQARQS